jgi:hypothetical protein
MQKALTSIPLKHGTTGAAGRRVPPRWLRPAAIAAAVFGAGTLVSGAATLFGPQQVKAAAGPVVEFVLWFNFLAGFAYLAGAYALYRGRRWARGAAAVIAGATALVAIAFTFYTMAGGAFSWRTPAALLLRFGFWAAIAWGLCHRTTARGSNA